MSDVERHNLREIEHLNQRGGRALSVVDLIDAGTVSPEMAAHALCAISQGASFLTAARPGGAGKTTVLACLLAMLPPGERIVTVSDRSVLRHARSRDASDKLCYLAHEIGSGSWYGYIWGRDVVDFLDLMGHGHRVASCIHADTLDELHGILVDDLSVPEAAFNSLDLLLFMHMDGGHFGRRRRVITFYDKGEAEHALTYEWDGRDDSFRRANGQREELGDYLDFIHQLVSEDVRDFAESRARFVQFYNTRS